MAAGAGGARVLGVVVVAGQATDALVDAHAGAVIPRARLAVRLRRVALVAEPLPRVGAHGHLPLAVEHLRNGHLQRPDVTLRPPVEERQ